MTLEEEWVVFMSLVGETIAMWALVEKNLNEVVVSFLPADQREQITIGFFRLEGFRTKLVFADGAVAAKIAASEFGNWVDLVGRMEASSKSRNRIAHLPVGMDAKAAVGRRITFRPWIKKVPVDSDDTVPPPLILAASDVLRTLEEFQALSTTLENLVARLGGQPEPHPKSAEQATYEMTVRNRLRQIHAELGHPQLSSKEKRRLRDEENAAASLRNPIEGANDEGMK